MTLQPPSYIQTLTPYRPGKPIEETQREYGLSEVIKLASNENPLGPSPKAVEAMKQDLTESHRYPDANAYYLREALSKHLGVDQNELIFGAGSDQVIDFFVRSYLVPGDEALTSQGAFVAFLVNATIQGVRVVQTPLTTDQRFDAEALIQEIQRNSKIKMLYLANPNNPTGTYLTSEEVDAILHTIEQTGRSIMVLLDCAYQEYIDAKDIPNPLEIRKKYQNIVVLRTFSKVYGLGGMRIGYGITTPEIIEPVQRIRQPFSNNSLSLVAAKAALSDQEFVKKSVQVNMEGKKKFEAFFNESQIPHCPTQGNFFLIHTQSGFGMSGTDVYEQALKRGVIFRPVGNYGLGGHLRVSIGTQKENEKAMSILKEILGQV